MSDSIDDQYCYQLTRICTSYHRINSENIYKIINTLVYHLIYNEKFNDYPFKESLVQQTLINLFTHFKTDKNHFNLDHYKVYIHNEVWKHKQLKYEQDDEKNNRSKCCKSCL
jgi:hypothetical protein